MNLILIMASSYMPALITKPSYARLKRKLISSFGMAEITTSHSTKLI